MPDKKGPPPHDPKTTLLIVVCCLVLSIPFAGLAINLESTLMPEPPLADASIIIQGPHIALYAGAASFIATAIISSLGATLLRHSKPNHAVIAMVTFGGAGVNFAVQLIVLAVIYVTVLTKPQTNDPRQVRFVGGQYLTNGRQFTRETWSCTMSGLHLDREPWSINACSEFVRPHLNPPVSMRGTPG